MRTTIKLYFAEAVVSKHVTMKEGLRPFTILTETLDISLDVYDFMFPGTGR